MGRASEIGGATRREEMESGREVQNSPCAKSQHRSHHQNERPHKPKPGPRAANGGRRRLPLCRQGDTGPLRAARKSSHPPFCSAKPFPSSPHLVHSTTSFSLVEKSKYPPSAQQKGRTRMSGFESQSAHNGAHSGTPSRRSPDTPQVQWKRALPLFSSHQGSSRVEVVRARQLGFVQEAGGDHSVTTLSAGPWCGPSLPWLLRDNHNGPQPFPSYKFSSVVYRTGTDNSQSQLSGFSG